MANTKTAELDALHGPYPKKILAFAIPIILNSLFHRLYNTADMLVVGRFAANAETALAAVGTTGGLTNLVISLCMGLSVGAGVCLSHRIGERDESGADRVVHTAITISVLLGVLISAIGYLAAPTLLSWMGVPAGEVHRAATLYIRIIFIGTPASMLYNYCATLLRSAGDSKRPMTFLTASGLFNLALNLILVAIFHLDVAGVAIATAASNYLSVVLVLAHMARGRGVLRFSVRRMGIDKKELKKILYIGIPSGIQSSLFSLSNVLVQSAINSFGAAMMAGSSVADTLVSFIYAIINSFYHVALTFVGQNVGAKQYRNVKRIAALCILFSTVGGFGLGVIILALHEPLVSLFVTGEEAVHAAAFVNLSVVSVTYFLAGIMDVLAGVMRAMGKSVSTMFISLLSICGLRILWTQTIFKLIPTPVCLFLSYPASWAMGTVVYLIVLSRILPRLIASQENEMSD